MSELFLVVLTVSSAGLRPTPNQTDTRDDRYPRGDVCALVAAERKGLGLLNVIQAAGLIGSGRTELEVECDIFTIASKTFSISQHRHDRIVRAGPTRCALPGEAVPDRVIDDDDIVLLDLGPVFGIRKADVWRS